MFSISNWSQKFENADTRKRQRLGWFYAPSGCDSRGYRKLMRKGKNGVLAYGVFMALCQYMATLPKEIRGSFANSDGSAMDIEDISEITRIEVADLQHATSTLVECGWLTLMESIICQSSASHLPAHASPILGLCEGKGEGKGEGKEKPTAKKAGENLPFDSEKFAEAWGEWETYRAEIKKKLTPSTIKKQLNALSKLTETDAICTINLSIQNGWQGLFPERSGGHSGAARGNRNAAHNDRNAGTANAGRAADYADLG